MDETAKTPEKPAFWAVLPAAVRYDEDLPPNAKLLYAEISALTDQRGYCYASNDYFQRLYGLGERTIRRLLSELQRLGYITIADGDGGKDRRRIYAGINPLLGNPAKNGREPGQNLPGNPAKNGRQNKIDNKIDNIPPISPQGDGASEPPKKRRELKTAPDWKPEMFARFWAAYPCGKDKQAAICEWDRLKPDLKLMRKMSAALERDKSSPEWRRGIGIPYACRWLSKRRWEDEQREPLQASETPPPDQSKEEANIPWI